VPAVAAVIGGAALLAPAAGRSLITVPLTWAAAMLAAVVSGRAVGYGLLRGHRRRSPGRATIVVGSGDLAVRLAEALREDRSYGLAPVGFVGPPTLIRPTWNARSPGTSRCT
jgi:FlaA1/EpsC-like NDP-sugar epimerase